MWFRKPCSGYKLKEITGNGIFAAGSGNNAAPESNDASNKTGLRTYQQALNGVSQISFSVDEHVTPKKPITIPEVAKQRELSGTLQSDSDSKSNKHISNAKSKELTGNDIFGPPPETVPRSAAAAHTLETRETRDMGEPAPRNLRTSVKVSNVSLLFHWMNFLHSYLHVAGPVMIVWIIRDYNTKSDFHNYSIELCN